MYRSQVIYDVYPLNNRRVHEYQVYPNHLLANSPTLTALSISFNIYHANGILTHGSIPSTT